MSDHDDGDVSGSDYVKVATVSGPIEEEQLRSFLEAHGIEVKTRGEAIRWIHGITVDGIGAVDIEVPKRFADTARELIARAEGGELQLGEDFDERSDDDVNDR